MCTAHHSWSPCTEHRTCAEPPTPRTQHTIRGHRVHSVVTVCRAHMWRHHTHSSCSSSPSSSPSPSHPWVHMLLHMYLARYRSILSCVLRGGQGRGGRAEEIARPARWLMKEGSDEKNCLFSRRIGAAKRTRLQYKVRREAPPRNGATHSAPLTHSPLLIIYTF